MFGWIIGGLVVAAFGGIAINESLKTTGQKVKNGDSVFVPPNAIKLLEVASTAPEAAMLATFLNSFISTSIRVTGVILDKNDASRASGNITGFPKMLSFPLAAVTSIDRNGARIV